MNNCYHCSADFPTHDYLAIYCDSCRWDLHYSRNWYYKEYTKEEWKNEQRLQRLREW